MCFYLFRDLLIYIRVLSQIGSYRIGTLADLFSVIGIPGTGLLNDSHIDTEIDDFRQMRDTFSVVDLDLTGLNPDTKEGAKFTVTTTAEVAPDTWTIAGSQEILGSGWDVTDANNDMTVGEDGITYTLVKENVVVKGGNFFYKVVKNHSWSNENYGKDGSWEENAELAIAAPGTYTVTFTFVNDETHALTAVAEMTAEPTIIIAGGFAQYNAETETYADEVPAFFGTAWDPTAEANKMVLNAESGKYEIAFNNVELPGAGNINYKAVMNGNWDFSWGTNEGGNGYYWINEAGNYNVTFTFDLSKTE